MRSMTRCDMMRLLQDSVDIMSLKERISALLTSVKPENKDASSGPYTVVYDISNGSLISILSSSAAGMLLCESLLDTGYTNNIRSPYLAVLKNEEPRTYPEWTWDPFKQEFKRTHPEIVTEDMRERAILANKKGAAFIYAINAINSIRQKVRTGVWFQERIHEIKEQQARLLKEKNFDAAYADQAPYIVDEATDRGISLREAAEDIIVHADLFNEYLQRTERARLGFFRGLKKAKTAEEIDAIIKDFKANGIL